MDAVASRNQYQVWCHWLTSCQL